MEGVSAVLSRHSLTLPVTQRSTWWWFSPTSPTGPVKITAGSAAPLPASRHMVAPNQPVEARSRATSSDKHEGGGWGGGGTATCILVLFVFFLLSMCMCVDAAGSSVELQPRRIFTVTRRLSDETLAVLLLHFKLHLHLDVFSLPKRETACVIIFYTHILCPRQ